MGHHRRHPALVLREALVVLCVLFAHALVQRLVDFCGGGSGVRRGQAPCDKGLLQRGVEHGKVRDAAEPPKALADDAPLGLAQALPNHLCVPHDVVRPVHGEVVGLGLRGGHGLEGGAGDGGGAPGASLVEEEDAEGLAGLVEPPAGLRGARALEPRPALEVEEVGERVGRPPRGSHLPREHLDRLLPLEIAVFAVFCGVPRPAGVVERHFEEELPQVQAVHDVRGAPRRRHGPQRRLDGVAPP
mmetsp:Transcript_2375/g.5512  ORF Transcript_2375/g.5512 Transcript_2375/m.5512 type:complete len:244 (+) Transcript_2375:805-1536(+)